MAIRVSTACSRPCTAFPTRFYSRSFDATLQTARSLSLQCRDFHSSLPAMKKKQKGKAVSEDQDGQFGFEAQDDGDLFGDLAAEATKTTKTAPAILSTPKEVVKTNIQPNTATYSSEKKAQFEDLFSRLENKAGKPPAPLKKYYKPIPPPEFGLLASLLALVQTPGDYERFTQILAQWRQYPRKFGSQFMEHVISRGISVGAAPQALDILLHQPKFGISLRRTTTARQLMHALCVADPSPFTPPEEQRHIPYSERIEQALQFAALLPHANLIPLTNDLTSSSLVLFLMCRASGPTLTGQTLEPLLSGGEIARAQPPQTDQVPTTQWQEPIQELLSSLKQSQKLKMLAFPHHRSERVWTLNSLRFATPLLREWNMKDVRWVEGRAMTLERLLAPRRPAQGLAVAG